MKHIKEIRDALEALLSETRAMRSDMKEWKKYDTLNHHENDKKVTDLFAKMVEQIGKIASKVGV